MVVHTAAQLVDYVSVPQLIGGSIAAAGLWSVKAWAGGRKCTWEREWAGKMILIVGPPTTTVLSLIDTLLRLPSPPQILYLPPLPSPLPQDLLTILHTLRLSTSNPQAGLHCEPLPPTPKGVREFMMKWGSTPQGTASESGRRVDAVILAQDWEVLSPKREESMRFVSSTGPGDSDASTSEKRSQNTTTPLESDPPWTTHQFHFHFLTSLLPHLLKIQAERNIRIISLISPAYAASLPSLQSLHPSPNSTSPLIRSGEKGLTSLLLMARLGLILDALAESTYGKEKPVPSADGDVKVEKKKVVGNTKSNIMAVSVVMPWCRGDVLRGIWGADETWLRWFMYMLFFPLLLLFTPSPTKSVNSILYALSAPVRYGPLNPTSTVAVTSIQPIQPGEEPGPGSRTSTSTKGGKEEEEGDPRRKGVAGGDTVRDCAVIDLPPVLLDPAVAKAHWDKIEKEVEEGVRKSHIRQKAFMESEKTKTKSGESDIKAE